MNGTNFITLNITASISNLEQLKQIRLNVMHLANTLFQPQVATETFIIDSATNSLLNLGLNPIFGSPLSDYNCFFGLRGVLGLPVDQ